MYTKAELQETAVLNQQLDVFVQEMSKKKHPSAKCNFQLSAGLEGWKLEHYDSILNAHIAIITKGKQKIIAIAQNYTPDNPLPLMVKENLDNDINEILTALEKRLSDIEKDDNVILSGYRNGGAMAEILSLRFNKRCMSFYSPGIERLMPVLAKTKSFAGISAKNNRILGIDGIPNDYNTSYGSVGLKIRLPIPIYDEELAARAKVFVRDYLISVPFITAAFTALPCGGILKQLSTVLPFLVNSSPIHLTVLDLLIVEGVNFKFNADRIKVIVDEIDTKQHDMKVFADMATDIANERMNYQFQVFESFEWPRPIQNIAQKVVENVGDARYLAEFRLLVNEGIGYFFLPRIYTHELIFPDYLNEAKNRQLKNLNHREFLASFDEVNAWFHERKVLDEVEGFVWVPSDDDSEDCMTTKSCLTIWSDTANQKINPINDYLPQKKHR